MDMTKIRKSHTGRGFTLVEALIGSIIMATGLFVVIAAISSQITLLNMDREKIIATLAAQEEIENIRGMPFDSILSLGSSSSFTASGFAYLNNPSGTITIDNSYSPISGASDIRRVSVTVNWSSSTGSALQKRQTTLVTRGGIDKQ